MIACTPQPHSPHTPKTFNGQPFALRKHQISALKAWKANDFKGTFNHATGSGKTITAIHAVITLSKAIDGLACVIAVPYQNLADQWVEILSKFNIFPIKCYDSQSLWLNELKKKTSELSMGNRNFMSIVVVNRTLKDTNFQFYLRKINNQRMIWIGDECHHHTSKVYDGFLPIHARYRIGLSATPEHYFDENRNVRMIKFYGETVSRYTLKDAISDKALSPYLYYPHLVEFSVQEAENYIDISEKIGRYFAQSDSDLSDIPVHIRSLLMRRARLIGSAENKIPILKSLLIEKKPTPHTLFYCGDGIVETEYEENALGEALRQVEAISIMLHDMSWDVSRFTSRESRKDRQKMLENFRLGIIDAMVAIRCLDEGIDIPACSTAYILASSNDPRQFIQRRGRILRRSKGKEMAYIHDFIVILPNKFSEASYFAKQLVKSELSRVAEFSSLSENRSDAYHSLASVLRAYDLEHMI